MPTNTKPKTLFNNSICCKDLVDPQYVKVELFSSGTPVYALVDTGAGTSVANPKLLSKLPSDIELRKSEFDHMTTVSGDSMNISGVVDISGTIAGNPIKLAVQIIPESLYELVLGRDFLQANGAVIDFQQRTFMLQSGSKDIKAVCTFEIPPKSEALIFGKVSESTQNIIGLCQGHRVSSGLGLCVAKSLVKPDQGRLPVRLLNPSDQSVYVYKNTKIGKFSPVEEHITTHTHHLVSQTWPSRLIL